MAFEFLNAQQEDELLTLALDVSTRVRSVLAELGGELRKATASLKEAASGIPGHPELSYTKPTTGEFIALAIDMRDSTRHLRIARRGKYSLTERVYAETNVLLPLCARAITMLGVSVIEYTGDGFLALVNVRNSEDKHAFYAARKAAKTAIEVVKRIVNPTLAEDFDLAPLSIGVGLAYSKAIVSSIGDPSGLLQDNAFGDCVFFASKLSKWGRNQIFADDTFERLYPESPTGKLRFRRESREDISGHQII